MSDTGRILGIDYGSRRVGLALSDEAGMFASPHGTLEGDSPRALLQHIEELCREKRVGLIVVGLPLNMNGTPGPAAETVRQFAATLRQRTRLPVKEWDERLSSQQAERVLLESDMSRRRRKQVIDKLAAQVILQSYLEYAALVRERTDAADAL